MGMSAIEVIPDALTARDVLADGDCSAACLLAFADDLCQCRCDGQYHGALLDAALKPRPHGHDRPEREQMSPEDKIAEIEKLLTDRCEGAELRLRVAQVVWACDARTAARKLGMPVSTYYRVRDASASGNATEC